MTVLPTAVAVRAEIPAVPPRFSVPVAAFTKVPVPSSAVLTVSELVLVSEVGELTVTLGIVKVPVRVCAVAVSKVCTPLPPLNAEVVVIPPRKVTGEFPELFQLAPVLIVTKPAKIFVPVAEVMFRMPLVPPPTVVVPVTVNAKPAALKVVPLPTTKFPPIPRVSTVVVATVPLRVRLPATAVAACKVLLPLPERVKWP